MLGRKKKRQNSISSINPVSAQHASSSTAFGGSEQGNTTTSHASTSNSTSGSGGRAFNYFVERAKGAVGFGSRERTKSNSSDDSISTNSRSYPLSSSQSSYNIYGAPSSGSNSIDSSRPSFARDYSLDSSTATPTLTATAQPMSIPYSASMQEINHHPSLDSTRQIVANPSAGAAPSTSSSSSFFRRQTTLSNPLKPAWLTDKTPRNQSIPATSSGLTPSPSSPVLSSQAGDATSATSPYAATPRRRKEGGGSPVSLANTAKFLLESHGSTNSYRQQLLNPTRQNYSRSSEDVTTRRQSRMWSAEDAPPVPTLARRSTDELNRAEPPANGVASTSGANTLTVEPARRVRTTSLNPSTALSSYPSSTNLSTSAPSSTRGSRSPSPVASPRLQPIDNQTALPTSASTPNFGAVRPTAGSFSSTNTNMTSATNTTAATTAMSQSTTITQQSPTLAEEGDRRRDSQTIHFQGFLQRKADYIPTASNKVSPSGQTPSGSTPSILTTGASPSYFMPRAPSPRLRPSKSNSELDLGRGWKPYRAILKGSKLYLHKPPADLASTAKTMFPTTILDDEAIPLTPSPRTPAGFDDGQKRRQRAYWGAGGSSHPKLIAAEDVAPGRPRVKGGTLEALTHEIVFATTFNSVKTDEANQSKVSVVLESEDVSSITDLSAPYDNYLDTFLLVRPFISSPTSIVPSELQRFAGLAVRTCQESEMATPEATKLLEARLSKFVEFNLEKYAQDLFEGEAAAEWRGTIEEILKQDLILRANDDPAGADRLQKMWTRTIEEGKSSPKMGSRVMTEWSSSTYAPSPRSGPTSVSSSPSKGKKRSATPEPSSVSMPQPESLLQLTPHALVQLDPSAFAEQIHAFHLDRLAAISSQPATTSRLILRAAASIASSEGSSRSPNVISMFSFSPASPHFLTRVAINSILAPLTATAAGPTSVVHMRAAVVSQWISIGQALRKRGDAAGWVAIAMGLCCRAVARLDETWRSVDTDKVDLVRHDWATVLRSINYLDKEDATLRSLSIDSAEAGAAVPFLGSIVEEAAAALRLARAPSTEHPDTIMLMPFYELREKFETLSKVWKRESMTSLSFTPDPRLQLFLQSSSRSNHPERPHLSAYLASSHEIEARPAAQGVNLLAKPRSPHEPSPLLPLIMVEPLPHISLVDQKRILASAAGALKQKPSYSNIGASSSASSVQQGGARDLLRRASYPPHAGSANLGLGVFARLRSEIADSADTLLSFADGDIVFTIVSNAVRTVPSTPTIYQNERGTLSRTSSWIESRSSRVAARGTRRHSLTASLAPLSRVSSRRTSSPSGSSRSSQHGPISTSKLQAASEEEPVYVVVSSGTVEAFVDLLVVGISNLRTPSTDADGQSSLTGRRPLELDSEDFRAAFFATFRSFTTPMALIDMLRKRHLAAPNAAQDWLNLTSERPFPTWSLSPVPDGVEVDQERVMAIRLGVLKNIAFWMEHHVNDFLDDDELFTSTLTFLNFVSTTERSTTRSALDEDDVFAEVRRMMKRFGVDSLRPAVRSRSNEPSLSAPPISFDDHTSEQLVDRLDQIACRLMNDLHENDVLRYIELLESSMLADPGVWYSSRSMKTDDEDLVIADSYATLDAAQSDLYLLRKMPINLQQAMRAHHVVRKWIIAHLVEPEIGVRQRTTRMLKLLEIIEISRSRMSNVSFGGNIEALESVHDPSLASFVERAVISAVVSPESRLFASAWHGVASARQAPSFDSLTAFIQPRIIMTDATATLDPAWLNERLIEIATQVESLSDGVSINFSKRRWIFNTIRNALMIRPSQPSFATDDPLALIERKLASWGTWSIKVLRDAAGTEGSKSTRSLKPFSRLVIAQQDKIRRDRSTREIVTKSQKSELQQRAAREKELSKAMDKSASMKTRRMTALFRGATHRPLPVSTSAPVPLPPPISPSPYALQTLKEWMPSSKPYLVLPLSGVEVVPYENAQRSYVFELITEDGQRSLFQAANKHELRRWVDHFRRCGSEIAFRRATFLAQTALAEEPEEPKLATKQVKSTPSAIFGAALYELVAREGTTIPRFVEAALDTIGERGLLEVGIYRISGENRVIQDFRQILDRGGDPSALLSGTDVHNVTGLLKLFLREMPEPLIPYDLYEPFITANAIEDYDERLYAIRDLAWRLPQPNFHLMRRLAEHLDKVTDHEEVNSMHAANLSIIFAPTLLKPPPGPTAFGLSMTNLGKAANIIKSFILQQNWIFGEETVEEDVEQHTPSQEGSRVLEGDEVATGTQALANEDAEAPDAGKTEAIGLGLVHHTTPPLDIEPTHQQSPAVDEDLTVTMPVMASDSGDVDFKVEQPAHAEEPISDPDAQYATIHSAADLATGQKAKFEHQIVPPSPLDAVEALTQPTHQESLGPVVS